MINQQDEQYAQMRRAAGVPEQQIQAELSQRGSIAPAAFQGGAALGPQGGGMDQVQLPQRSGFVQQQLDPIQPFPPQQPVQPQQLPPQPQPNIQQQMQQMNGQLAPLSPEAAAADAEMVKRVRAAEAAREQEHAARRQQIAAQGQQLVNRAGGNLPPLSPEDQAKVNRYRSERSHSRPGGRA